MAPVPAVRTMFTTHEGSANAMDLSRDYKQIVIAGRSVFKIYSIDEDGFVERLNLRGGKNMNLNYSCNDVVWSPFDETMIATAATNGAVVIWNLNKNSRCKQEHVFSEHKRTVNRVIFHPTEATQLLSGSQDGTMKLFDLRYPESVARFESRTESIRDVQFNPYTPTQFAAVSENGKVQLWDTRRPDRPEKNWPAHSNHVFACDWHPEIRNCLATAGRDKSVKVWDTSRSPKLDNQVHTIGPVGKVKWRPQRKEQLASSALVNDFNVNVWDVRRPYVSFASFTEHRDVVTGIAWKGDPHCLISSSKDGTLYQHSFQDAARPGDLATPVGLDINPRGDISHTFRDQSGGETKPMIGQGTAGSKVIGGLFRPKHPSTNELFRMCHSAFKVHQVTPPKPAEKPQEDIDFFDPTGRKTNSIGSSAAAEEEVKAHTDLTWIVDSAKRYILAGRPFVEMLEHNSRVCESLDRRYEALSWSILKSLYGFDFLEMDETEDEIDNPQQETTPSTADRNRRPSRTSGDRPGAVRSGGRVPSGGGAARTRPSGSGDGEQEDDEDDEESLDELNERTLTNIASGQMLTNFTGDDFFGDNDYAGLGIEHYVNQNIMDGQTAAAGSDWTLPAEAFDLRHEIKESTTHAEAAEEFQQQDNEEASDEPMVQTVTVEDQTAALNLIGIEPFQLEAWDPSGTVKDILVHYAENGDIQTAVCMYIVLGSERTKGLRLPEAIVENWFLGYLDLLHRFNLNNEATQLINLSPVTYVHRMNLISTKYFSNCTTCNKALDRPQGAWWCERCKNTPNLCAICHRIVKGLFVWCQGCGHGGHIEHLEQWYQDNMMCPTGCGHYCEYQ